MLLSSAYHRCCYRSSVTLTLLSTQTSRQRHQAPGGTRHCCYRCLIEWAVAVAAISGVLQVGKLPQFSQPQSLAFACAAFVPGAGVPPTLQQVPGVTWLMGAMPNLEGGSSLPPQVGSSPPAARQGLPGPTEVQQPAACGSKATWLAALSDHCLLPQQVGSGA
jgi:hypothetical protein